MIPDDVEPGPGAHPTIRSPQSAYYRGLSEASELLDALVAEASSAGLTVDPIQAARALHRLGEQLTSELEELDRRDCRSGCSACCHFEVGIRVPEALLLARAVGELPDRNTVLQRLEQVSVSARGLRPCPLLGEDGRCLSYADRPLPCRGWSAESRALCDAHLGDRSVAPAHLPAGYALFLAIGHAFDEWIEAAGLEPGPGPLQSRLLSALGS